MTPVPESITELQIRLLWDLMQTDERREVALAYVRSPEFQALCAAAGRPDIPGSVTDATAARLAGLFHAIHQKKKRSRI